MDVKLKRIYEEAATGDGFRVLVDRLWPRGVSKERAALDLWEKEVAPSDDLRTRFHHDGMPWPAFEKAYRAELADNPALDELRTVCEQHRLVTLLYAAHDPDHNQAVVLRDILAGT